MLRDNILILLGLIDGPKTGDELEKFFQESFGLQLNLTAVVSLMDRSPRKVIITGGENKYAITKHGKAAIQNHPLINFIVERRLRLPVTLSKTQP